MAIKSLYKKNWLQSLFFLSPHEAIVRRQLSVDQEKKKMLTNTVFFELLGL